MSFIGCLLFIGILIGVAVVVGILGSFPGQCSNCFEDKPHVGSWKVSPVFVAVMFCVFLVGIIGVKGYAEYTCWLWENPPPIPEPEPSPEILVTPETKDEVWTVHDLEIKEDRIEIVFRRFRDGRLICFKQNQKDGSAVIYKSLKRGDFVGFDTVPDTDNTGYDEPIYLKEKTGLTNIGPMHPNQGLEPEVVETLDGTEKIDPSNDLWIVYDLKQQDDSIEIVFKRLYDGRLASFQQDEKDGILPIYRSLNLGDVVTFDTVPATNTTNYKEPIYLKDSPPKKEFPEGNIGPTLPLPATANAGITTKSTPNSSEKKSGSGKVAIWVLTSLGVIAIIIAALASEQ